MFNRWRRGEHPDDGHVLAWARTLAPCAVFGLMLTVGVLLFGVSPNANIPVGPPTRHGVHPAHVPAKVEQGPHPRRCTYQSALPALCGRGHPPHAHERGHGAHRRLSPKELSLAKW